MRLDKFLSAQGGGTRSEAKRWLRAGRVTVDGVEARDPGLFVDAAMADVRLDGARLRYQAFLHVMLNKPAGVLTAARDPDRPTVMDLLPPQYAARGCMPVGRLDIDTEGLLLLTTDGKLSHSLLSPRRHVDKVYEAEVDGPLGPEDVEAFSAGIQLTDFRTRPAALTVLPEGNRARVTLREGKFHQVKRMFGARGRQVLRLKRVAFGGVPLDAALPPGGHRPLTEAEVAGLYEAAGGSADG